MTDAKRRANIKYLNKFERVVIRVPKEVKDIYADHAANHGESLSAFVKRALDETMERDNRQ